MAALTEEQSIIRDQAKSWVSEQAPVQKFREMRDTEAALNYTPTTWEDMVNMGWTGILIPEAYGGSDLGYLTFGLILEEVGRQLTASPLFASAFAGASAILVAGSEAQKQDLLPKVVEGSEILSLAFDEGTRHRPDRVETVATAKGEGYILNGAKSFVMEGMSATTLVVTARTEGAHSDEHGVSLFLVDANASGVEREALHMVDSRGYANVRLHDVEVAPAAVLGQAGQGSALAETILDRCRAGLSAEMLGTASQAFDMTLEYLKTREQFGRVIGSFQALGHRAAMLYSTMELARSCSEAALSAIDASLQGSGDDAGEIAQFSSLAKCRVGDFLHDMSNQLIQIHGGIGMTDEFDAGFYLKRARVLEAAYGNQAFHRDRYARLHGF